MQKMLMKKRAIVVFCLVLLVALVLLPLGGCKDSNTPNDENPAIMITLESGEQIKLELYPKIAPITVENFLRYVNDGFYDNTIFHRVIANLIMQGGGYTLTDNSIRQQEGIREQITGEFAENGIPNSIKHTAGVISMGRTSVNNSATSQFFLCTDMPKEQADLLNGKYAAFGRVTDSASLNVIRRLANVETSTYYDDNLQKFENFPIKPIRIASIIQTR